MTETESENLTFQVQAEHRDVRLDAFLALNIANWSRSRLQKIIDAGDVLVNGKASKSSFKLRELDEIEVELIAAPVEGFEPEDIPLDIIFEDQELAVVNKSAGMVVHPGAGIPDGTLANALVFHFQKQNPNVQTVSRAGIVHRLDKDTSGLIVVAKTEAAHENLSEQFRQRTVYKSYIALVHGKPEADAGKIEAKIGRDRINRVKISTNTQSGRPASSSWRVRERFGRFTLLDVEIHTGRTHQIRVHLAHIKHPVVGDALYNDGRDKVISDAKLKSDITKLNRFFLHAERLAFEHPTTNERLIFKQPLPPELDEFLQTLRQ